ncbi:MAG: RNA pseudouridine synthase [Deltaproteobacteria bacterium]|nr:RNA pseudouridine synthase [Deltaproteobacteria bacterium]
MSYSDELKIHYEDPQILVLEKPAGMAVFPFVAEALTRLYPAQKKIGKPLEAGIVHRLDNETSGLMVAARTDEIYEKLRDIWNTKAVTKEYTCLVHGKIPAEGRITLPIAHHPSKKKKMVVVKSGGREALTWYEKIKTVKIGGEIYSLLSVRIKTGVRHQIRVHLAMLGHPIAGDKVYSKKKSPFLRQFLHLSRLELPHLTFESPLPEDLKKVMPNA